MLSEPILFIFGLGQWENCVLSRGDVFVVFPTSAFCSIFEKPDFRVRSLKVLDRWHPFKLRFQEFFLAGFYFFEISTKSCARGSIFVKIFGRLRRPFFCHFFTVSPLINGQKPDFFSRASRAILRVGFYFFEISTDCFSRGTIFLKSLSNLCPRALEEGGF